jgi:SEC-C motif-containing protein
MKSACPCHSKQPYQACCEPLHQGQPSNSAEQLMRSRYSAYVLKLDTYLLHSWHASSRPDDLTQASLQGTKWLGLTITDTQLQDANHATVTFEARFRQGQAKTQTLKETSRFVLENNHWFYIDGDID